MNKKVLNSLNVLYNNACIEAGQQKGNITYAREIEHNEHIKKHFDIVENELNKLTTDVNELTSSYKRLEFVYKNECDDHDKSKNEINKLQKAIDIIMLWRDEQIIDLLNNLEEQNIEGHDILREVIFG